MFKKIMLAFSLLFILSCSPSGPQKTLDETAKAMESNNPQAFLANFNMPSYSANYLTTMTENDQMLSMLNSLGSSLGLDGINDLIGSMVDMEADIKKNFTMGVSTGELMAKCKTSETPDCPWVPASLREAQITEIGQNAAIAKVTTPARITSWISLRKTGEKWQIVGIAPLESQARKYSEIDSVPASKPSDTAKKLPQKQKGAEKPVHI